MPGAGDAEQRHQHPDGRADQVALVKDAVGAVGLAGTCVPCDQGGDTRRHRGEEHGDEHDGLVGEADRGDRGRADMAHHEGVDQPNRHVQQLLADGRQGQGQDALHRHRSVGPAGGRVDLLLASGA